MKHDPHDRTRKGRASAGPSDAGGHYVLSGSTDRHGARYSHQPGRSPRPRATARPSAGSGRLPQPAPGYVVASGSSTRLDAQSPQGQADAAAAGADCPRSGGSPASTSSTRLPESERPPQYHHEESGQEERWTPARPDHEGLEWTAWDNSFVGLGGQFDRPGFLEAYTPTIAELITPVSLVNNRPCIVAGEDGHSLPSPTLSTTSSLAVHPRLVYALTPHPSEPRAAREKRGE